MLARSIYALFIIGLGVNISAQTAQEGYCEALCQETCNDFYKNPKDQRIPQCIATCEEDKCPPNR